MRKDCQSIISLGMNSRVELIRTQFTSNMKYILTSVFGVFSILPCFPCLNLFLVERYNEILFNIDIKWMTIDLLQEVMFSTNCFVMVLDEYYQHIIGSGFNKDKPMDSKPYFKILVNDSEDLLSPNYETVKVILQAKKNSCNLYVVFLANGEQVARFLTFGDRHRTVDSRAKFVLMKDRRMFYQKYNVLWKKIVNVLFVKQYKNTPRFELSTVPFPPPLNGPIIPYKINTWDRGFQKNKILFQDKTSNLKGQTLKVVTFEHMPTTALITARNNSQIEDHIPQYTGLEIEVLKTLSRAMNFHYAIYEPPNANEEQWGRKQINGSFSGLLGEMCEGNADIALGNLYYTPYHLQMLDLSVPYNTECLTFLTPESLTDNSRQTLTLPFQGNMWVAVIITLFLGGFFFNFFALYHRYIENKDFSLMMDSDSETSEAEEPNKLKNFLKNKWRSVRLRLRSQWKKLNKKNEFLKKNKAALARKKLMMRYDWQRRLTHTFSSNDDEVVHIGLYIFERLDNSILYTYGMFMNVSLPKVPTGWSIRMFTGWWWLYCILVSVAYKASMTAILANPVPRVTIDTLEQLAESNIGCGGWGEQSKEFFVTSLDITSQKIGRKFEITYDIDSAVERVASGDFAYYENIHFLHYLTVKHKDENLLNRLNETDEKSIDKTKGKVLHVMFNCVINMPVSVGLQKNSPLKPKIDSYLSRVIEAGLVIKWLNDVMFKIRATEAKQDKQAIKALMNLSKLYGAVAVLLAGYAISIVILIWEIIMWYCVEKRSPDFDKYNLREYYAKKK